VVEETSYPEPMIRRVGTWDAVKRHRRLVAGITIAGVLGTYLVCHALTPLYASTATVLIDPRAAKRAAKEVDPNSFNPPSEEAVRRNEIAVIRSRDLVQSVISDLKLAGDPEFDTAKRPPGLLKKSVALVRDAFANLTTRLEAAIGQEAPPAEPANADAASAGPPAGSAVDIFLDRLLTKSPEASRVIEIRYLSEKPERAARIANAVADRYIREKTQYDYNESNTAAQALDSEVEQLNIEIRDKERTIAQMRSQQGLLPTEDRRAVSDQLAEWNKQLAAAAADRAVYAGRLAALEAARASGRIESMSVILNSPLVQRLRGDEAQLNARVSGLSESQRSTNPRMAEARAQLGSLRTQLNGEVARIVASYKSDLAAAEAKEQSLRRMYDVTVAALDKSNRADVDVRAIEREADAKKALMTQLVAQLNETRAQMHRSAPDARIISAATPSRAPAFPPTMAAVSVAFLFSLVGGAFLAVLIERQDDTVRSTAELRMLTRARILGSVPRLEDGRRLALPAPAQVLDDEKSMFTESLRGVWLQLDQARLAEAKTLVITSSLPSEGKSSIVTSLARLLARSGRRVVVVDADLRRPTVHHGLGVEASPGLAELLEGTCTRAQALQLDTASGANVITAGATDKSPAELLQSPRMAKLLLELSVSFDLVILDTPPILAVPDAGILARQADMTVLVVRWGATRTPTLTTAMQRLEDLNVSFGVILSRVDGKKSAGYGYGDAPPGQMSAYY
jgi:capsular exopolysaccharide synthesis family protein